MNEQSLIMIKPAGVNRGLVGEIIRRFENKSFKIIKIKMFQFSTELAQEFYSVHKDKPFFPELLEYITSGSVVAVVLSGDSAVDVIRKMIGATNPMKADSGTIRGDYGLDLTQNIIHASDSSENFERESEIIFRCRHNSKPTD